MKIKAELELESWREELIKLKESQPNYKDQKRTYKVIENGEEVHKTEDWYQMVNSSHQRFIKERENQLKNILKGGL